MQILLKKAIINVLKRFGVGITRYETLEGLRHNNSSLHDFKLLKALNREYNTHQVLKYFDNSKSQLRQDLFALSHLNFKENGYFIEFGATNGIELSNTYLMETVFGWNGILAEPATVWHTDLKANRKCNIDTNCVWTNSNSTIKFNQVAFAELSTISNYSDSDAHKQARKEGRTYNVNTISLNDLLAKYNAPKNIDYLSIDTEGSEYEILNNFDFSQHTFEVITCEHNYTPMREDLHHLLTSKGYRRIFEDLSLFDDWYVRK